VNSPIKVTINGALKELIPGYLENRNRDILALKGSLKTGDFESIRFLCHQIKGHGASYGFSQLSTIARGMEEVAESCDGKAVGEFLVQFEDYLKRLELEYT